MADWLKGLTFLSAASASADAARAAEAAEGLRDDLRRAERDAELRRSLSPSARAAENARLQQQLAEVAAARLAFEERLESDPEFRADYERRKAAHEAYFESERRKDVWFSVAVVVVGFLVFVGSCAACGACMDAHDTPRATRRTTARTVRPARTVRFTEWCNVRAGRGRDSSRLGVARPNTAYPLLETRAGWNRIRLPDGTIGWSGCATR